MGFLLAGTPFGQLAKGCESAHHKGNFQPGFPAGVALVVGFRCVASSRRRDASRHLEMANER
jgi:hypothetical protein